MNRRYYDSDYKQLAVDISLEQERNSGLDYTKLKEELQAEYPEIQPPSDRSLARWRKEIAGVYLDKRVVKEKPLVAAIQDIHQRGRIPSSLYELCDMVDASPKNVRDALQELIDKGANISFISEVSISASKEPRQIQSPHYVNAEHAGGNKYVVKFGACGDNHAGHKRFLKREWQDYLEQCYDAGCTFIAHTGNYLEGKPKDKFNAGEIERGGDTFEGQCEILFNSTPHRPDMPIKFISGECHEGWWSDHLGGYQMGRLLELEAKKYHRSDWQNLGDVERDIVVNCGDTGRFRMRLFHPGGGTAYALSYHTQKQVAALEEGEEKPKFLFVGHYHKALYMPNYSGVEAFQTGCFQDKSKFMKKKSLKAQVGGWIIEIVADSEGNIRAVNPTFIPFNNQTRYTDCEETMQ
jgi:hypothetical protein